MENKIVKHTYKGLKQDISNSKFSNQYYFEGKNIRLLATDSQSTGSITNTKGNISLFSIPIPIIDYNAKTISYNAKTLIFTTDEINYNIESGIQKIIAQTTTRECVILLTTDDNGIDCVWKVNLNDYDLELIYLRNLNFSTSNPPQIINNFENELVDKIYWVDGNNQMRFLNLKHSIDNDDLENLIDIPVNVIDMVGKYTLSQPTISNILTGGIHTAGMIQYAYNLYRLNSSQTKISPLSELVSLDKGSLGGGDINEVVGAMPVVNISNIDHNYTHIKVYAVKYTSYNEIPSISLIEDRQLPTIGDIQIFDDGKIIETISLEEFIFLGSNIIIPKHINTKFNRLFLANYKEINFNVDLDCRAYSFNNSGTAVVYKDLTTETVNVTKPYYPYAVVPTEKPTGTPFYITTDSDYDDTILIKHDSINLNYDIYKYQKNGTTYGGEGKYLKYQLTKSTIYNPDNKYFKDDEIYRIGIEFFNKYGQVSLPNWIADFKALDGNLQGQYNTLSVTLKPEFFTWLNTTNFESEYDKPIGYKILIADRTLNDRTIISNGLLSPMMVNDKSKKQVNYSKSEDRNYVKQQVNTLPKLPNILLRNYNKNTQFGSIQPLRGSLHLEEMSNNRESSNTEMPKAYYGDKDTSGRCYQYNTMFQLYSPEILFGESVVLSEGLQLKIKGSLKNNINNSWGKRYNTSNEQIILEQKVTNALSSVYGGTLDTILNNDSNNTPIWVYGLVSHPKGSDASKVHHIMYDRVYGGNSSADINTGLYIKAPTSIKYDIYGKPEITEKGQSGTTYNNDPNYRYINSLESIFTDGDTSWDDDGKYNRKIITINSYGNRCATLVVGSSDNTVEHYNRPTYESLGLLAGITGDDNGLIAELVKTDVEIYLGNIYGGNSYEDKRRTNYIEIGTYTELNEVTPTINIDSPGDTYVNFFKFARIVKTDTTNILEANFILEELITSICETTIDLKNRNDISFNEWDSKFQPLDADYHKYNNVYSQQPTLVQNRNLDYNIKKINNFDTNIISTKVKSAGEIIDNWTDISVNDVMTLDGKYGAINSLINFNDEIYSLQDSSLAFISINPRVQVQGEDGLSIELGSGNVLDRYKYISTTSGSINKWSVLSTPNAFYYYDLLNNSLMSFSGQLNKLSDSKGLHQFFINNNSIDNLKIDNPLFLTGISMGYDYVNNDLYISFKQSNKPTYTISFNEMLGEFVSLHDGIPSLYISRGSKFLTTNSDNTYLFEQNTGEYNNYYGEYKPSYIILNVNPESDLDTVFDNIMYKSEVYLDNIDQPDKTLTKVRLYNEYQDSGLVPLIVGRNSNLRRKFRDWNAILPRNQNSRERIRNPWVKLVLQFDNTSNYKLILHDVIIYYSI